MQCHTMCQKIEGETMRMTIMKSQLLNKTQILAKTLSFKHISNPIESCANQGGPLNSAMCTPFPKQWCMRQEAVQ